MVRLAQRTHLPSAALKVLRAAVLVRIVLVCALVLDIVFIVHALGVLFGVALGFLLVEPVLALGLGELVDLGTLSCVSM